MTLDVKICGLSTPETVAAAARGGAKYVGFNFFPPSPRNLDPLEAAPLVRGVPLGISRVGVVVDGDDAFLDAIMSHVPLDMLQFHGSESPGRVAEIKSRYGLPVIKSMAIAGPGDIEKARAYEGAADRLLFDAKPPPGASRPGGNAMAFDWELIRDHAWNLPWMLAGGLTAGNLAEAVAASGATCVDVSSDIEDAPGVKSIEKIGAFLEAAAKI
jgi:phosphoribosylanthranilate isomerase